MRILDQLLAYENRMSAGSILRNNRFVKHKSWYVNEDYIGKIVSYPIRPAKNKIPRIKRKTALGLTVNFVMRKKTHVLLPSTADVIEYRHFGDSLRAYYATSHRHRYTIKIVCDSDRRKFVEAVKREVAVREHLTSLKTINIPKVIGAERREDAFLLSEETILGRPFHARVDKALYRESFLPQLRDTYQAHGVRYAPIRTFLPPDISQGVTRLLGERADGERFVKALRNVIAIDGLAAVSLCHGFLSPGNLAVANGTVYFLDWKRAHEGLIISDLLQTAVKYPKHYYIVKYIRDIMTSNFMDNSCRFEELLTAGIALEILHVSPRRIPKLLHIWRHHSS